MNQEIRLENLAVQTVLNSSGVFCGKNLQVSWSSVNKTNQGCGTIGGDCNLITASVNSVCDGDLIDFYAPQEKGASL